MDQEGIRRLVAEVQRQQMELDGIEAKAGRGGTPKVYDSLSAFANRSGGGVILLGLDEKQQFKVVGVGDPQKIQADISNCARHEMEPPIQPQFSFAEIDGKTVIAVEVAEIGQDQKPCFYKSKGLRGNGGAYIRSGGTDRPMSDYEIFTYISSRGQPTDDQHPVTETTLADLDENLLDDHLERLRRNSSPARARLLKGDRQEVLTRLWIGRPDGSDWHPTLAGLLMFGKYPQEYFPNLRITFMQFYGTTEGEPTPRGERFLDNPSFEGPIPEMLDAAETHILAAMRKASLIDGVLRRDIPEYPQEALREALANAVVHRDYSGFAQGSQIQVKMFADRLEVTSPGGLHGNITVENLDQEQSTRNARLMRLMEDARLVENRGSGINAMLQALGEANLEPPRFDDRRSSFQVTFRNHTLLNPEAVTWLNQFAGLPLNDRQRLALVYLRQRQYVNNSDYRRLNRVDSALAGQELRGLVQAGLIEQNNAGRWTHYTLKVAAESPEQLAPQSDEDRIVAHVQRYGSINNPEVRQLLGIKESQAYYLLRKLHETGRLRPEGKARYRRYVLP